jgi:hypothetical protein
MFYKFLTTHPWEYLLIHHSSLQGDSFTNWAKVTRRHNDFVQKILQSRTHIIATIRTKQVYVLSEKDSMIFPEKAGLKLFNVTTWSTGSHW